MKCNHPIWSPVCSFHYNGECFREHNYECPALQKPTDDVIEFVRCRGCKDYKQNGGEWISPPRPTGSALAENERRKKMPRYIDADELLTDKNQHYDWLSDEHYVRVRTIELMPIADVVERKKGKWKDDGKGLYMCSSCGKLWVHWWARVVPLNQMCKELRYCPMCGAEMEKTDETN